MVGVKDLTVEKATEKAAAYINIKPRTEFQVKKYLGDKGYTAEIIESAIEQLKEYRYIDDMAYAMMYFRYGFEKGRGISRIKRELADKGVDYDVIALALEETDEIPDQFELAMDIARQMLRDIVPEDLTYDEIRKLKAKIGRRLLSRGFTTDITYKVIGQLLK